MLKTGTLFLIKSRNPAVFDTPLRIMYRRGPEMGESFLFGHRPFSQCNLSYTKRLFRFWKLTVIQTRNSWYVLWED